ncbi:mitochondrial carrier [Myriangium duriaei CBS 260.36]|uniref:Mitochondrial carrier n=1 Tax=Myriangium duriaei CBS 260.36 TaxID=1168546 RepID=A0A9P4J216_9PEZI|nr:mitochondrial carrier [Myriangium duriaei CBS 260.36]
MAEPPPYNSQLDAFELYHRIQEDDSPAKGGLGLPALGHALAGSAGTAISHLFLYPLDLSITRLQVQKQLRGAGETPSTASDSDIEYKGIVDAVKKIYKNEGGLKAFYAGCLTDTAKSIVDAFLFFLLYTFLRTRRLQSLGKRNLPVPDELRIGIAAGLFSKFVTTPISQIVTRKQTAAMVAARDPTSSLPPNQINNLSIKDIALQIRSERGITGFWAGYRASIILTLNPALTFLFHNLLTRTLLPASKREKPGPKITFVLAALSKAAASATMYPFSLAKTRAQIASSHASPAVKSDDEKHTQTPSRPRPQGLAKKPSPVLTSLKHIYTTEGVTALYSGLSGEVLKGFLGHGLTMLLKERIHIFIVGMYFLALKVGRRSKEGSKGLREDVAEEMGKVARKAAESLGEVVEGVVEGAKEIGDKFKDSV